MMGPQTAHTVVMIIPALSGTKEDGTAGLCGLITTASSGTHPIGGLGSAVRFHQQLPRCGQETVRVEQ